MNIVLVMLGVLLLMVYIWWLLLGRIRLSRPVVLITDVLVIVVCALVACGLIWMKH